MVVPLVVGAARVATTTAKVGTRAGKTAIKAGRATSKAGTRGARAAHNITKPVRRNSRKSVIGKNRSDARQNVLNPRPTTSKIKKKFRSVKHTIKGFSLTWQLLWFYPLQLLLAFIAYASYSALNTEYGFFWGIAMKFGGFAVAQGMLFMAWMINLAVGTSLLLYTAIMCNFVYKLKIWRYATPFFAFMFCLWGYWAPYYMLMFVPWVIIWVWVIVWSQK